MELIRNANEVVAKIKDENGDLYNVGLGKESINLSEQELIEIAKKTFLEIKYIESNPFPPDYKVLRAKEYPPIEEQLDLIYWDKINGTNNWEKAILAVKEKYPKN